MFGLVFLCVSSGSGLNILFYAVTAMTRCCRGMITVRGIQLPNHDFSINYKYSADNTLYLSITQTDSVSNHKQLFISSKLSDLSVVTPKSRYTLECLC